MLLNWLGISKLSLHTHCHTTKNLHRVQRPGSHIWLNFDGTFAALMLHVLYVLVLFWFLAGRRLVFFRDCAYYFQLLSRRSSTLVGSGSLGTRSSNNFFYSLGQVPVRLDFRLRNWEVVLDLGSCWHDGKLLSGLASGFRCLARNWLPWRLGVPLLLKLNFGVRA